MPLQRGVPYRLTARVPLSHVAAIRKAHGDRGQKALLADVSTRVAASGFETPMAVLQDPTDNQLFTAIARFLGKATPQIQIVRWEAVTEPPTHEEVIPGVLDAGLTADEVAVVRRALVTETNIRHVYGLASTMEPFFPIAASLLRAKGTMLESRAVRNDGLMRANNRALLERVASHVEKETGGSWPVGRVKDIIDGQSDLATTMPLATSEATRGSWPETEEMWAHYSGPAEPWVKRDHLAAAVAAIPLIRDGMRPEDLFAKGWFEHYARADVPEMRNDPRLRLRRLEEARAQSGMPARQWLISNHRGALASYRDGVRIDGQPFPREVLHDEVKRAICTLMAKPDADLKNMPAPVVALARDCLTELGRGVWVVRPIDLYAALPVEGDEGFVSPTALQLALAQTKPIWSGVAATKKVPAVLATVGPDQANKRDARQRMRAKNQMERANRALERRRWVEWYKKTAKVVT